MQNNQNVAQIELPNIELLADNFEISELEARTENWTSGSFSCSFECSW